MPLCCQQRPVPRTLRWQGVPFCVRAPQMDTTSFGSVGRSVVVPSGPYFGSGLGVAEAPASPSTSAASLPICVVIAVAGGSSPRCTIKGGGAGRVARPAASPIEMSVAQAISGARICALRKWPSQSGQKRRLVQKRQRARVIFDPHSAQKFGLYILEKPPSCGKGCSVRIV
jgi:hypothetical protein